MLTGAAIEALRQQGALRWQGPLRGDALPLRLGPQLGGWIATLSHAARVGLMSHLASPAIMSGWDGHLTLEVHNAGPASLLLRRGMPVAKALLYRLEGPPSPAEPSPYYCGASAHLGSFCAEFTCPGAAGGSSPATATGSCCRPSAALSPATAC